jgi:hypothetical protein
VSYLIAGISDGGLNEFNLALLLLPPLCILAVPLVWCAIIFWIGGLVEARLERKRREQECAGQDLPS